MGQATGWMGVGGAYWVLHVRHMPGEPRGQPIRILTPGTNGPQENFGSLQHAAACFKLLVKGTTIFRNRHTFQKPDQNTVNHMP